MCNVGTSNSGSVKLQADIRAMPIWLQPTAGFGVGLQSIFLLTDQFEIDTNTGTEAFHAVAHSHRKGGYLQLQRAGKLLKRGTTIRITFRMPKRFSFSFSGDTENYLSLHFDPMSSDDHTGEVRILEAINTNCGGSMFPIQVSCTEDYLNNVEITESLPACNDNAKNWSIEEGRYRFRLEEDCSQIQLWDMDKAAYGEFRLIGIDHSWTHIRFKGIDVDKGTPTLRQECISALVDVYGMDTKDTISLDRSSLTQQGLENVAQILEDMFDTYKKCVLEQLENDSPEKRAEICNSANFNPYSFWRLCDLKQREKIPRDMLENITETATVLVKNEQGQYSVQDIAVKELIPFGVDTYFINLEMFNKNGGPNTFDYEKICTILNKAVNLTVEKIIADKRLIETTRFHYWEKLKIPVLDEPLLLYTISLSGQRLLSVDDNTKLAVLRGLSGTIKGMKYNHFSKCLAKRYAIPGLDDYSDLAVDQIPFGIVMPRDSNGFYPIIAPFDREEAAKRTKLTKEGFTEMVLSSITFYKVVKYVLKHSYQKSSLTEDKIIFAYRHLIEEYYIAVSNS
jgi:hypothetical protein